MSIVRPLLPIPPSWYPGHMSKFAKALPALLTKTDVVLELRDARLPLTSINGTLEGGFTYFFLHLGLVLVEARAISSAVSATPRT
jgi:mitochondrial GTPase 1